MVPNEAALFTKFGGVGDANDTGFTLCLENEAGLADCALKVFAWNGADVEDTVGLLKGEPL